MVVVLPAPFGPEESEDLAAPDLQVEVLDGVHGAVMLGEPLGQDGGR